MNEGYSGRAKASAREMNYTIWCPRCGEEIISKGYVYLCPECGGILEIEFDLSRLKKELPTDWPRIGIGMETYKKLLPIDEDSEWVSLGEGFTPLVPSVTSLGCKVYFKNEGTNPTGSFKDRPISIVVTKARSMGAQILITSSSGNAGVSLAAYAARANLTAYVLVAGNTSFGKLKQMSAHGAKIFRIKGDVSRALEAATAVSKELGWVNAATTFLSPFPTQGDKTVAYELFVQLGRDTPDWVFVPIGAGPLLAGCYQGFDELVQLGISDKVPHRAGVQAEGCCPIATAFQQNAAHVVPWESPVNTLATGIADPLTGYLQDGEYTLNIIRRTHGVAVAVSESEILKATKHLAEREGIWAEPSGAVGLAALWKLLKEGIIQVNERVVLLITGHGFKEPVVPDSEYPLIEDLSSFIRRREHSGYTVEL